MGMFAFGQAVARKTHFPRKRPDGSPMFENPHPCLARGEVRFAGDPVAYVVAEAPAQAKDAAETIEIEYHPLPAARRRNLAIETADHPVPTKQNPLGVKGAGEAGTVGAIPEVMSAAFDALAPLGIRHIEMPLTPEKIWRTINSSKEPHHV